jgi:hypothetical protein
MVRRIRNRKSFAILQAKNSLSSTVYCVDVYNTANSTAGLLKGIATRFSASGFFHELVSPKSLGIHYTLGPFRFFSKILGDIRSSRCTTGVVDTDGKWKISSIRKVLIILFRHLWVVGLTNR